MAHWNHCLCVFLAALLVGAYGQEPDTGRGGDSVTLLVNTHCYVRLEGGDSIIECRFSFNSDRIPQYFVDINSRDQTIVLTLAHVRCGGFTASDSVEKVAIGPIKTILLHEDFQNANQGIKGMLPDLYEVVIASIKCVPVVKNDGMSIRDSGRNIFIDFRWPSDIRKRRQLYGAPQPGHKGIIASIAAVSAAGLAAGGYFYWKSHKKKTTILEPVLPDHPPVE